MSGGWLFAIGVLVTLIVAVGVGLPVYGAILDGRDEAERQTAESHSTSKGGVHLVAELEAPDEGAQLSDRRLPPAA